MQNIKHIDKKMCLPNYFIVYCLSTCNLCKVTRYGLEWLLGQKQNTVKLWKHEKPWKQEMWLLKANGCLVQV